MKVKEYGAQEQCPLHKKCSENVHCLMFGNRAVCMCMCIHAYAHVCVLENYKQEEKQHIKFKQYQVTSSIYGQIRGKHMDREIS